MSASWSQKYRMDLWLWVTPAFDAICELTKGSFRGLCVSARSRKVKNTAEFKMELIKQLWS